MPALKHADLELLSAYLDDALPPQDRAALERRLVAEPDLRAELEALRAVVDRVRALPTLTAPRDFRLDPAVYGRQRAQPQPRRMAASRVYYRWGSALSALAAAITLAIGVLGLIGPQFNASQSAVLLQEAVEMDDGSAAARSAPQVAGLPTLGATVIPLEQAGRGAGPEAGGAGEPVESSAAEAESFAADAVEAPAVEESIAAIPDGALGMGGGGTLSSGEPAVPPVALSAPGMEEGAPAEALPFAAEAEVSAAEAEVPAVEAEVPAAEVEGAAAAADSLGAADVTNATGQIAAQMPATKTGLPTAVLPVTEVALLPTSSPAATLQPELAEAAPVQEPAAAETPATTLYASEQDAILRIDPGIFLGASVVLLALAAALFALSRRR